MERELRKKKLIQTLVPLDTLLTFADTIETMTDSHTDNKISLELVDTSSPSDSIETDEDSHQTYQHENRDLIDSSPSRQRKLRNVTH